MDAVNHLQVELASQPADRVMTPQVTRFAIFRSDGSDGLKKGAFYAMEADRSISLLVDYLNGQPIWVGQ